MRSGELVRAVDDVSLDIYQGEFFAMLGPSGCGKTTTLRMIAGFEEPSSGEILLRGRPVQNIPAFHRPVNTVFQDYALFPHMSVLQNVMFGLEMEGVSKQEAKRRANEALEMVRLTGVERKPRQLSGGQQQRVALARALVLEPRVLLFDEPLSNLDARLRRSMREEIRALQQRLALTVAYVTHDQSEALAVSDQIVVMDAGRIAQAGTPEQLYAQPESEFVAGFMGEAMLFAGEALADGRVRLGPLAVPVRRPARPGKVKLAVRPEAWQVAAPGAGTLAGTLVKMAYLGSFLELTVATELGEIFVVSPDVDRRWQPGDTLALVLSGRNVSVVAAE